MYMCMCVCSWFVQPGGLEIADEANLADLRTRSWDTNGLRSGVYYIVMAREFVIAVVFIS